MERNYDVVGDEGALRVYKTGLHWKRARRITVRDLDGRRLTTRPFPADRDALHIPDLPPGRTCRVEIGHADPLRRLLGKPARYHVETAPGRLRALVSGSGRCGTQSMARFLDGLRYADGSPCMARHETLWEHVLQALIDDDRDALRTFLRGFPHHMEAAPHFSLVPELIEADHVVHLIRDGRRVVQSGLNRGWYARESVWNTIKPEFSGDVFERCCRFWAHTVGNMDSVADAVFRLEDLAADRDAVDALVAELGLAPTTRPFPQANAGDRASTTEGWTRAQTACFEAHCGELMDRHYPGWRD